MGWDNFKMKLDSLSFSRQLLAFNTINRGDERNGAPGEIFFSMSGAQITN
jgi:hypothetical protein